jgi:hypothetical protein
LKLKSTDNTRQTFSSFPESNPLYIKPGKLLQCWKCHPQILIADISLYDRLHRI